MTVYLGNDLWAKQCISLAETRINATEFTSRLRARVEFGCAVSLGVVAAAVYAVATVLLLVPHLLASGTRNVVDLRLCDWICQQFDLASDRCQRAIVASVVASVSAFSLGFSTSARKYFNERLDRHWAAYKENLAQRMRSHCQQVAAAKVAGVLAEDVYRPTRGKAFTETLADGIANSMVSYCKAFQLGTDVDHKYERYALARTKLDAMIRQRTYELKYLPVTLVDVGGWRLAEAKKLRGKAMEFFEEEVCAERERCWQLNPAKFPASQFSQKVGELRTRIEERLDRELTEMKQSQLYFTTAWNTQVGDIKQQQSQLQSQVDGYLRSAARAQWCLNTFSAILPDQVQGYLQSYIIPSLDQVQVTTRLNAVKAQRIAIVNHVSQGAFLTFSQRYMNFENYFANLVGADGDIQTRLKAIGRPPLSTRVWRSLAPVTKRFPDFYAKMDQLLDP